MEDVTIREFIDNLTDDEVKYLYAKMQLIKLRQLLGRQPIPDIARNVLDYADTFKDDRDNTLLWIDVFNYGRIYGIQQERARRRNKKKDDDV